MLSKNISFTHKGETKTIPVLLPESLSEASSLQTEEYLLSAVHEKLITDAKSAAIGRKKRKRILKINLTEQNSEVLQTLKSLNLI